MGPRSAQEEEVWSRRMQIIRVVDRTTANRAIDDIIEDGEGAPAKREGSHYDTFLKLRAELSAQPSFEPARPVVLNPRTRPHRDFAFPSTLLQNQNAIRLAELSNSYYEIVLLMLLQLYSYEGETFGERSALRAASRQMMTMAIRPLAEILTEIPAMNDPTGGTAGPSFELYSPVELPTQKQNCWILLNERYESVILDTIKLADIHPHLAFIAENIRLIQNNVNNARVVEERL
jgi:Ferritin-like